MEQEIPDQTKRGIGFALGAFIIWGMNPIYFRLVREASFAEITAHRVVWMLIILLGVAVVTRKLGVLKKYLQNKRIMGFLFLSAVLIAGNWLAFTYAVMHDRVLHASMGYFINPLCNVFLGMVFLRERLRPGQTVSVLLAAAGVLYMIIQYGSLPWVAIILPLSFGSYGLLRKRIDIDSFNGLLIESIILVPFALGFLVYLAATDGIVFMNKDMDFKLLMMMTGPLTIAPLMLFASGIKRIPYSTVGILQYLAPSLSFLLGVFAFQEAFDRVQLVTFCCIWSSLLIFSVEGVLHGRKISQATPELGYNAE